MGPKWGPKQFKNWAPNGPRIKWAPNRGLLRALIFYFSQIPLLINPTVNTNIRYCHKLKTHLPQDQGFNTDLLDRLGEFKPLLFGTMKLTQCFSMCSAHCPFVITKCWYSTKPLISVAIYFSGHPPDCLEARAGEISPS